MRRAEPPAPGDRDAPIRERTPPRRRADELLVVTYNVHRCIGVDGLRRPRRIAQVLRELDPDLIALQEVDTRLDAFGLPGQLEVVAEGLEAEVFAGPTIQHVNGFYGNALMVRRTLAGAARAVRLHDLSVDGREPRGAIELELEVPDRGRLRVLATHLGLRPFERRTQTTSLLELVGREVPCSRLGRLQPSTPMLLLGDFNEWWPLSRVLSRLRRRLGPAPRPRSWPAQRPTLALDRIWSCPHRLLRGWGALDSPLTRVASDHLPVWARIALPTRPAGRDPALATRHGAPYSEQ